MTRREGGGEEGGWKMSRRQRGEVWRIWCRGSSRCFMVVNDHHHSFDGCWRCWWFQSITFLDRILFLVILLLPTVTIPPLVLLHWREKPRNIVYGYWRKGLLIHIFKLGFPFLSVDGCSPFHHYYDDYYGGLHFTIIMVVGVVLPAHSATTETCSLVELQARTVPCRDGSLENGEILFFLLGSGSRNPSLYVGQSILINTSSDDERMNIASSLVYTI